MSADRLCMGCMAERGEAAECPACGFVEATPPDSPLHLPPRTLLREQYLLGRVLGHGGFGITYLAWDLNLSLKVAVKEYLPGDLATRAGDRRTVSPYTGEAKQYFEYGLTQFLEEARALARFQQHPGIVSVLNFFRVNGTGYLVMSYLEGITFKEYLESQGGAIPYDVALRVVMPVMDALREVHQVGMLHRDVSPDNVYITTGRQVKLLDFGAARNAMGERSRSMSVVLKPGYAPEEQYRTRGKQGPWTDVYALAATLYRAITGRTPPESLDRLESDELVPPSRLGLAIPPGAERALLKALAVRAGERFQTVAEFQERLIAASDEPMTVRPAPGPRRELALAREAEPPPTPAAVPATATPAPAPERPPWEVETAPRARPSAARAPRPPLSLAALRRDPTPALVAAGTAGAFAAHASSFQLLGAVSGDPLLLAVPALRLPAALGALLTLATALIVVAGAGLMLTGRPRGRWVAGLGAGALGLVVALRLLVTLVVAFSSPYATSTVVPFLLTFVGPSVLVAVAEIAVAGLAIVLLAAPGLRPVR